MRFNITILLLLMVVSYWRVNAQDFYQQAEVISSGGGETIGGSYSNFTVLGETFVNHPVSGDNYLTSIGFIFAGAAMPSSISGYFFNNSIHVFPNPVSKILFIEMQSAISANISIVNILGVCVYFANIQNKNITIDVSSLQPSVYFLRLYDPEGRILLTKQLIKE